MPRKPLADKGMQTSVRLPSDLYERLAAAAGDRGIGEIIRDRLEMSFVEDPYEAESPQGHELLTAISWALRLSGAGRERVWSEDPDTFWFLRAAAIDLLDRYRPEGAGTPKEQGEGAKFLAHVALLHARGQV